MQYEISDNNLKLFDSYQVSKKNFGTELEAIKEKEPNYQVWNRGMAQMKLEWATHNFCYMVHLFRSHTKDVDLNYPQSFIERAFYAVMGCLVWIFVK